MEVVDYIFETDTVRMIDSNGDNPIVSWFNESSDTLYIKDTGYLWLCQRLWIKRHRSFYIQHSKRYT